MKTWPKVKLGDVCEIARGGSPRPIADYITDSPDGVNWIKIGDADENDKYILSAKQKIKPEGVKKSRFVRSGDFLLSNSMSFGRPYILAIDGCIHDGWLTLRDKAQYFTPDYLYYALSSQAVYRQFQLLAVGGVVNNLNSETVKKVAFPLPPLEEQERIAAELDAVVATLKKRQTQLAELDALVEARFVELFGEPLVNSRGWKIKKLDELYEIIDGDRGKCYPKQEEFLTEGHCLFLNAKNVTKNGFCFAERLFITREKDEILRTGKLKKNDIVLTTRGTIGNVAYYDSSVSFEHIRINSGMVLLRNCSSGVSMPYFIEFFRRFKPFQRLITGTAQPQLPISLLRQIDVPTPPLELQERFAAEVERVEALKVKVRDGIAETQTLFDALTQGYFG